MSVACLRLCAGQRGILAGCGGPGLRQCAPTLLLLVSCTLGTYDPPLAGQVTRGEAVKPILGLKTSASEKSCFHDGRRFEYHHLAFAEKARAGASLESKHSPSVHLPGLKRF